MNRLRRSTREAGNHAQAALPSYGYDKGQPYYAVNLLSEIDVPGEWYLDRATGILYLYPPSDPDAATVELSTIDFPMVEMDGVSHVAFEGSAGNSAAPTGFASAAASTACLAGCTIRRTAGNGVEIHGGHDHGLLSCNIHSMGRGGVVVTGGDRKTLTPGAISSRTATSTTSRGSTTPTRRPCSSTAWAAGSRIT